MNMTGRVSLDCSQVTVIASFSSFVIAAALVKQEGIPKDDKMHACSNSRYISSMTYCRRILCVLAYVHAHVCGWSYICMCTVFVETIGFYNLYHR